jgi:hypothetical protein
MNAPTPQPVTAVQVAAFLKRHLRNVRDWPRAKIVPWVAWFLRADRALVLTDEGNRICGVALGRFVPAVGEVHGRGLYDVPTGPVLWVDAIATCRAAAMPHLVALLVIKYGPREIVAGECFSRDGELRMFPMKTLQRFFGGPKP